MSYFDDKSALIEEKKIIDNLLCSQGYCIICNHGDPLDLEFHHIAGKANSPLVVSLCRNCHGRISRKQRFWPKDWAKPNKPEKRKQFFVMLGLNDLLSILICKMIEDE
ncbi:MAG: hypothetical protein KC444_10290 [Nitrosopumilus sp.]|nr:hypothetical protein [Nitrosopumilus sp.]